MTLAPRRSSRAAKTSSSRLSGMAMVRPARGWASRHWAQVYPAANRVSATLSPAKSAMLRPSGRARGVPLGDSWRSKPLRGCALPHRPSAGAGSLRPVTGRPGSGWGCCGSSRCCRSRWMLTVGTLFGAILRRLALGWARTARRNIELCLPELGPAERNRLLNRHFAEPRYCAAGSPACLVDATVAARPDHQRRGRSAPARRARPRPWRHTAHGAFHADGDGRPDVGLGRAGECPLSSDEERSSGLRARPLPLRSRRPPDSS